MMKPNRCFGLVSAVLGVVIVSTGRADVGYIPIVNASFEQPSYAPYAFGPATGWTSAGSGSGAFHSLIGVETNYIPDGVQAGFAGSLAPGSLTQDLGVQVIVGESYQLSVFVGSRLEGYSANWLVQLFAGSTVIGSASGTICQGTGNFFLEQINATGSGSGDLIIKLSETGNGQSLFDDVTLQGSFNSVPEPTSLALTVIAGLTGLVYARLSRRRAFHGA